MSRFRADSEVGVANREAAHAAVPEGPATRRVLEEALAWAEATDGAFDPCLGRATGLWDVNRRKEPPPGEEVRALAGRRLYEGLDLGRASVRFADSDVAIDLGAIGKGWAVDRAVDALRAAGVSDAIVNLGGDLYAMGESEDGDPWRIGVRSAADPSRCDRVLEVRDEAVATSGDYLQGFRSGGVLYHHLLDPATGAPVRAPRHSLSIAAPTCTAADAAATAVFGAPRNVADPILRTRGARIVDEA
jgi:thiamine biosynthesis lipoprotein